MILWKWVPHGSSQYCAHNFTENTQPVLSSKFLSYKWQWKYCRPLSTSKWWVLFFFLSGMLSSFNTTRPLSSKSMVFLCQYCHSTLSFGICAQYEPNRVWNMDRQKKKNLEEPFPSKKMKKSWSFVHWQRFSPKTIFQCWSMNKLSLTGTECCIHTGTEHCDSGCGADTSVQHQVSCNYWKTPHSQIVCAR